MIDKRKLFMVIVSMMSIIFVVLCFNINSLAKGIPSEMDSLIEGVLEEKDDTLTYSFDPGKSSYVNLSFVPDEDPGEKCWDVTIYFLDGMRETIFSQKNISSAFKSKRIVCHGSSETLYVKIESSVRSAGKAPIGIGFSFSLLSTVEDNFETEYNDSEKKANSFSSKKPICGVLSSKDDRDYYKYTIKKNGYVQFKFIPQETGKVNGGWKITIGDKDAWSYEESKRIKAKGFTSSRFNFKKGTVLYICVEPYDYDKEKSLPDDIKYSLSAKETTTKNWEIEGNDSFKKAIKLKKNKKITGTLYGIDDDDYYKFVPTKKNRVLIFTAKGKKSKMGKGFNVIVYNGKKQEIWYEDDCTRLVLILGTSCFNKTCYIKICADDISVPAIDVNYNLKLTNKYK